MQKIKNPLSIFFLIINDVVVLFFSFLLAYTLRSYILVPIIPSFKTQPPLPLMTILRLGFFYGAFIIVVVMAYYKLYTRRRSFWEETKYLIESVTISFILITVIVFISRQYIYFSRVIIIFSWLSSLLFLPLSRLATKNILFRLSLWRKKVLILGTNISAPLVTQGIKNNPILGYEVAGLLSKNKPTSKKNLSGYRILGTLQDVKKISRLLNVQDIIIALPDLSQGELIKVIESCEPFARTIRIVPKIGSLFTLGVKVENLGDILSLSLSRNLTKPLNTFLKHIVEYIMVLILSLLFLPFFLLIALAIKFDSWGPVLFIQKRLGKGGKIFSIYKFRSMYEDEASRLQAYLKNNPQEKKKWEMYQKIRENDPRVTRVGKFFRKWSIDELPQLINILKGDMSLVGPRPYLPREKQKMGNSYNIISRVKPGMTGFWQVRGRNLLPFKQRLLLDEHYIRNWSLWLDFVILLKTAKVLTKREGAF